MTVRLRTTSAATFSATADWTDRPTYSTAWIREGGVDYFFGSDDFSAPEVLENRDSYSIPVGTTYDLTFTPDDASAGQADQAMARLMNAGSDEVILRLSLHDGDPGENGTANEIDPTTNLGYGRTTATFEVAAV